MQNSQKHAESDQNLRGGRKNFSKGRQKLAQKDTDGFASRNRP
jgi:hypothetical protein